MGDELRTLANEWNYWNDLARVPDVMASVDCPDCLISFICADQAFHIRRDYDWWVVDSVDDRGSRYNDIARFSTIGLLEKYLTWLWGSSTRSTLSLPSLGAEFFSRGRNPSVTVVPTDGEWKMEIVSAAGRLFYLNPH